MKNTIDLKEKTYRVQKVGDIDALHRNGKILFCPFKPNLIIPTQLGQIQMHREPCGSWCPLFPYSENQQMDSIHLDCQHSITATNFSL